MKTNAWRRGVLGLLGALLSTAPSAAFEAKIPASIARVTDSSLNASDAKPDYILIQDIHRHPEAQGAIASILLYGRQAWGFRQILIEGAFETVKTHSLNRENLNRELQEGLISGAEMASALQPALSLQGIEDAEIYQQDLLAYQQTRDLQDDALKQLETIRLLQKAWDLSGNRYSPQQLAWMEQLVRLKMKPADYAAYLQNPPVRITSPELARAVESAETFYRLADLRSLIFLEKARQAADGGPRVLVTGGFHTAKMTEELRRRGASYIVLSPTVTRTADAAVYEQALQNSLWSLTNASR